MRIVLNLLRILVFGRPLRPIRRLPAHVRSAKLDEHRVRLHSEVASRGLRRGA
jgi:hypothetical protein